MPAAFGFGCKMTFFDLFFQFTGFQILRKRSVCSAPKKISADNMSLLLNDALFRGKREQKLATFD